MTLVSDLEIIPSLDKFVIGGKRLYFYENVAFTKNMKNFNDEISAIAVEFNEYYNWFVVLTKFTLFFKKIKKLLFKIELILEFTML